MKNKGKTVVAAVLLVVVLIGASLGYRYLSDRYENEAESSLQEVKEEGENGEGSAEKHPGEDAETAGERDDSSAEESADPGTTGEAPSEETSGDQRVMAPDFSMLDENGEKVSLSDYFGKPVVLNFWATWCGPCKMEMPHFDKAYEEYKDEIHFLIVDLTDGSRDTVESASAFVEEEGYSFPIFFDTEYEGANTYGVSSIPMTFFIDSEGALEAYQIGTLSEDALMGQLEKMAGKAKEEEA